MNENDATSRLLGEDQWRAFRIFLSTLNDQDFDTARDQLIRELAARRECGSNVFRMFYSSLTDQELQMVQREIAFQSQPPIQPKRARAAGKRSFVQRKPHR